MNCSISKEKKKEKMSNYLTLFYDWNTCSVVNGYLKYVDGLSVKTERTTIPEHMDRIYVVNPYKTFYLMAICAEDEPEDNWFITQIKTKNDYEKEIKTYFEQMEETMEQTIKKETCEFSKLKYNVTIHTTYSKNDNLKFILYTFVPKKK